MWRRGVCDKKEFSGNIVEDDECKRFDGMTTKSGR